MTCPYRIGFGYDIHPFADGRRLVLGGVEIAFERGLAGHSDADVLLHAVADAILGAAGLPDIGHYFPSGDPACRGIDSRRIVERARTEAASRGWRVGNADVTVIAERPRVGPYREAICGNLAGLLGVERDSVALKATTHEKLGALGRGEGIAVHAVVLLYREPGSVSG